MAARKAGMASGVEVARISVKVSPDSKKFRAELKSELEQIERTLKADIRVKAHLDSAQARADFERMKNQMQKSGRIKVGVDLVPGKGGSVGRAGRGKEEEESVGRLRSVFQKMANKLKESPNFGTGINLTGMLFILTALSLVIAPLVGILTGLLLTLPGLLSLVLTPILALTLGLEGLKKAAQSLAEPFNQLKAVMTAAVEEQFTPVFQRLKEIFPTLERTLPGVTQGLADMLNSIVGVVVSPAGLQMIGDIIDGIGRALTAAAPGLGSFTSGLLTLTNSFVNGGALAGLVDWFNGAMASFSNFMREMEASGQLDGIFQSLGTSLKIVADGLGAIAKIGLDTLTDPEAMLAFLAILKFVMGTLVAFMLLSKGFLNFIGSAAIFVAEKVVQLGVLLSSLGAKIAELVADAAEFFSGLVAGLASAFATLVTIVGELVTSIVEWFKSLPDKIAGAWEDLKATAVDAFNGLLEAARTAFDSLVSAVQTGVDTVVSFITALPGRIIDGLGDLGSLLVASGKALIAGFISGIKGMIGAAVDAAKSVVSAVRDLFPFSPAKEGPFSGEGWVYYSGRSVGEGFADGLKDSTKSAVDAAKEMATRIKAALDEGTDGNGLFSTLDADELKRMNRALEEERKRLKIQKNDIADKDGKKIVQNQIDQLQGYKDILAYQRDRMSNEKSYNREQQSGEDPFVKAASGLMKSPTDFLQATGQQFMSDIGISGDGLIGRAITEGISYVFNIGSVDEALSIKDREDSKAALPMIGR